MHSASLACECISRRLPYIPNNWDEHAISRQLASRLLSDADKKERAERTQENPPQPLAEIAPAQSHLSRFNSLSLLCLTHGGKRLLG